MDGARRRAPKGTNKHLIINPNRNCALESRSLLFRYLSFCSCSLNSKPPNFATEDKQAEVHARWGVSYIGACFVAWRLAVPELRISIGWFHAFSYSPKSNKYERQLFTQPYYVYHANDSNEHGCFFMSSSGD